MSTTRIDSTTIIGSVLFTLLGLCWAAPSSAVDGADLRIMVSGDSVSGGFEQASYRMPLYNSLIDRGCIVDMVGDQRDNTFTIKNTKYESRDYPSFDRIEFPDHPVGASWSKSQGDDTDHQAFGGLTSNELRNGLVGVNGTAEPVSVYAQIYAPDYILMHYGTNDVSSRIGFANTGKPLTESKINGFAIQTAANVTGAIDDILASHPNPERLKILVGNFIPRESHRVTLAIDVLKEKAVSDAYRIALTDAINSRSTSNPNIRLVDVATGFDAQSMTFDGIHPNRAGEVHIASAFEQMIVETGGCENASPVEVDINATPEMLTPISSDPINGDSVGVSWTANEQADIEYWWIRAGIHADARYDKQRDYYNSGFITNADATSHPVSGLPGGGETVYLSLWYFAHGEWFLASVKPYINTGRASGPSAVPTILTPTPSSLINGNSLDITWSANGATNIKRWWVRAGQNSNGYYDSVNDYYNSGSIVDPATTGTTITGLPADGSTIYITLWYFQNGAWRQTGVHSHISIP